MTAQGVPSHYYSARGDIRGDCGHRHRTLSGAYRCLQRDRDGCAQQGGYSDRHIVDQAGDRVSDTHLDSVCYEGGY